jgi:hypothetical protein
VELKLSFILAGLSGGALGLALGLNGERTMSAWANIEMIFGQTERVHFLKTAIGWSNSFKVEVDKITKEEDSPNAKTEFMSLILNTLRLWWRDVTVLAATGNINSLLGPPASQCQKKWAKKITARSLDGLEKSMANLADGLNRSMSISLVFENYWLDVLEYI